MREQELKGIVRELDGFAERYRPFFGRPELGNHSGEYLKGLLGPAERKSVEPLALEQGENVGVMQHFIGQARWRDERVIGEHQRHVKETLGRRDGILIFDSSGFPKKGEHSVGVQRQWCGNVGKEEDCQVG